jgi:hypothetical protein
MGSMCNTANYRRQFVPNKTGSASRSSLRNTLQDLRGKSGLQLEKSTLIILASKKSPFASLSGQQVAYVGASDDYLAKGEARPIRYESMPMSHSVGIRTVWPANFVAA